MNLSQSINFVLWTTMQMSWNVFLAVIPIVLARLIVPKKSKIVDFVILIIWLLFLPNTLYLITDGMYVFSEKFGNMNYIGMALGVCVYAIVVALAPYTYYWSTKPVIKKYKKAINQQRRLFVFFSLLIFSFLVALGITMGRFARTNSWHVFTNPSRLPEDILHVFAYWQSVVFLIAFFFGALILNTFILYNTRSLKSKPLKKPKI